MIVKKLSERKGTLSALHKCFKLELWHFDYERELEFWEFLSALFSISHISHDIFNSILKLDASFDISSISPLSLCKFLIPLRFAI